MVSFIKAYPSNSHIFNVLCDKVDSAYEQLLIHSQVLWLSHGMVPTNLVQLHDEVQIFLSDNTSQGSDWHVCLIFIPI